MRESAYLIARLRATRTIPVALSDSIDVERALAAAGRSLVPVRDSMDQPAVALGWSDLVEPDPEPTNVIVQRMTPSALTTFAVCLGLCWPDDAAEPYPGEASTVDAVLNAAARRHVHETWAKAALFHDLPAAGLLEVAATHGDATIRLGPAVAAWPAGQLALLRRAHDRLPKPEKPS